MREEQIKAVAGPRNHRQLTPRFFGTGALFFGVICIAKGNNSGNIAVEFRVKAAAVLSRAQDNLVDQSIAHFHSAALASFCPAVDTLEAANGVCQIH